LEFYTEVLGLSPKMQSPVLALLDAGQITLGLSPGHLRLAPQTVGATEVVFHVPSVRDAQKELARRGVTFLSEPGQATATEWVAHFRDPDGHLLSLFGKE
jgi:predicted enzyme related to lactoylglutathione lyase